VGGWHSVLVTLLHRPKADATKWYIVSRCDVLAEALSIGSIQAKKYLIMVSFFDHVLTLFLGARARKKNTNNQSTDKKQTQFFPISPGILFPYLPGVPFAISPQVYLSL
jgi:hypothetical protein